MHVLHHDLFYLQRWVANDVRRLRLVSTRTRWPQTLARRSAERSANAAAARDPSAPSGQTPPYVKPTRQGRARPKGGHPGHPGHRRPTPAPIDRREEHALAACPKCHGPVRPCRGSRTRVIEDIPADIAPVVTEHTIHRSWRPDGHAHVEPAVPDALSDYNAIHQGFIWKPGIGTEADFCPSPGI